MKPLGGPLRLTPRRGAVELVHALDGDEKVLATFWPMATDPDRLTEALETSEDEGLRGKIRGVIIIS